VPPDTRRASGPSVAGGRRDILVPLDLLEPPSARIRGSPRTIDRYRSYTCGERQVHLAELVLEQHEDDPFAVDGRCRDRHARHRDARAMRLLA
jgi:hypothetical protein